MNPDLKHPSLGVDEDAFLAGITRALADRGDSIDPPALDAARVVAPDENLVERFIEMAAAAGMKPTRFDTLSAATENLLEILHGLSARTVLLPPEPWPGRDDFAAAVAKAGIASADVLDPDAAFDVDVGITGVRMAIAETGSLVLDSGPDRARLASLAVPVHFAVLREDRIVADLLDWIADGDADPPANVVLITGPSKTADIEMNLVTGVHGPGEVHIFLLPAHY
jgi:L-lactate utilization protein LutC